MDRATKLQLMRERFVHPNSRYAEQVYADGSSKLKEGTHYFRQRIGNCQHEVRHVRLDECDHVQDAIFSDRELAEHLKGKKTYAPYQLNDEGMVKWLCMDIDGYDNVDLTRPLFDAVGATRKLLGPNTFLVEASGSKGYHVWVFFTEPVEAAYANALGNQLTHTIQRTKELNIEIYPKQIVATKGIGSTVKLPLGIHKKTGNRCLFIKSDLTPHEDQWKVLQNVKTISREWMHENIEPTTIEQTINSDGISGPHCFRDILSAGCHEGLRDVAAFSLSNYLRDKGLPIDMSRQILHAWNARNKPPMDEHDIEIKIQQGYSDVVYGWNPCNNPSFDHVCRSSCTLFQRKVQQRWFSEPEKAVGVISRD